MEKHKKIVVKKEFELCSNNSLKSFQKFFLNVCLSTSFNDSVSNTESIYVLISLINLGFREFLLYI